MWLRALLFILITVLHLEGESRERVELGWTLPKLSFEPSVAVAFWGVWWAACRRPGLLQREFR